MSVSSVIVIQATINPPSSPCRQPDSLSGVSVPWDRGCQDRCDRPEGDHDLALRDRSACDMIPKQTVISGTAATAGDMYVTRQTSAQRGW